MGALFENPGGKIKVLIYIQVILIAIGGAVGGVLIALETDDDLAFLFGAIGVVVGALIGWLSGLVLYAFAELVEDTAEIKWKLAKLAEKQLNQETEEVNAAPYSGQKAVKSRWPD